MNMKYKLSFSFLPSFGLGFLQTIIEFI